MGLGPWDLLPKSRAGEAPWFPIIRFVKDDAEQDARAGEPAVPETESETNDEATPTSRRGFFREDLAGAALDALDLSDAADACEGEVPRSPLRPGEQFVAGEDHCHDVA